MWLKLQRHRDIVRAVEQAVAAERVDFERDRQPVVVGDRLLFEVDRELVALVLGDGWNKSSITASSSLIGNMPFLKQLL